MKNAVRRRAACTILVICLLAVSLTPSAALLPETNLLFTADQVDQAVAQLEQSLGVKVVDDTGGLLTIRNLRELEAAINDYSLGFFQSAVRILEEQTGAKFTFWYTPYVDQEYVGMTSCSYPGDPAPIVQIELVVGVPAEFTDEDGGDRTTVVHELAHLFHFAYEAKAGQDVFSQTFPEYNQGLLYEYAFLLDQLMGLTGDDWNTKIDEFDTEDQLIDYLLQFCTEDELVAAFGAWDDYLLDNWLDLGRYVFAEQYGQTDAYEDLATIIESISRNAVNAETVLRCGEYGSIRKKYDLIVSSLSAAIPEAGRSPLLLVLDNQDQPADWAAAEVESARQKNLLPDEMQHNYAANISRKDFCKLLVALLDAHVGGDVRALLTVDGTAIPYAPFLDVDDPDVDLVYVLGIVSGKSASRFDPNGDITRQEAAKMLALTVESFTQSGKLPQAPVSEFDDRASFASWAVEFIDFVSAAGIMNGVGSGFSPTGAYTRQQAFLTVNRTFDLLQTVQ